MRDYNLNRSHGSAQTKIKKGNMKTKEDEESKGNGDVQEGMYTRSWGSRRRDERMF